MTRPLLLAAGLAGLALDVGYGALDAARHGAARALWAAARGAGRACAWLDATAGRVDRRARCAAGPHWIAEIDLDGGLCPRCAEARDWGPEGAVRIARTSSSTCTSAPRGCAERT